MSADLPSETMEKRVEKAAEYSSHAVANLHCVRLSYSVSLRKLSLNSGVPFARLKELYRSAITVEELHLLVHTLNDLCGLKLKVKDYLSKEAPKLPTRK